MGNLYVVATPIGNLEDISQRAVKVLQNVPLLIAEDTRVARKLIHSIDASPRLISYHRHSTTGKMRHIMDLLNQGDAALISDAGVPAINDPGAELVAEAARQGHRIIPLPGPSSITAALSVSGFNADRFASFGFLPSGNTSRRRVLQEIAQQPITCVFFETPHRLRDSLEEMSSIFGEREIVVCRELTKMHEEIWRGTVVQAIQHFDNPRGEFVIVSAPNEDGVKVGSAKSSPTDAEILSVADELSGPSISRRDLADRVANAMGISRRRAYQVIHRQG